MVYRTIQFVNGLSHTKKNNYPRGQTEKPSDLDSEDFVSSTLTVGTIHYHNSVRYAASYTLKQRGKGSSPNVAEVIM